MLSSGKDPLRDWIFLRDLFLKLVFHLILLVLILLFVMFLSFVHRTLATRDRIDLSRQTSISPVVYDKRRELTAAGAVGYCPRPNSGKLRYRQLRGKVISPTVPRHSDRL